MLDNLPMFHDLGGLITIRKHYNVTLVHVLDHIYSNGWKKTEEFLRPYPQVIHCTSHATKRTRKLFTPSLQSSKISCGLILNITWLFTNWYHMDWYNKLLYRYRGQSWHKLTCHSPISLCDQVCYYVLLCVCKTICLFGDLQKSSIAHKQCTLHMVTLFVVHNVRDKEAEGMIPYLRGQGLMVLFLL